MLTRDNLDFLNSLGNQLFVLVARFTFALLPKNTHIGSVWSSCEPYTEQQTSKVPEISAERHVKVCRKPHMQVGSTPNGVEKTDHSIPPTAVNTQCHQKIRPVTINLEAYCNFLDFLLFAFTYYENAATILFPVK